MREREKKTKVHNFLIHKKEKEREGEKKENAASMCMLLMNIHYSE
jgi:hypothetical protein